MELAHDEDDAPDEPVAMEMTVHGQDGRTVYIILARGPSTVFPQRLNNFFHKHILKKSAKGRTQEEKHARRFAKRNLTTANKKAGKGPAKVGLTNRPKDKTGPSWYDKYGAERGIEDNTAIDLTLVTFREVKDELFRALSTADFKKEGYSELPVKLLFKNNCVVSVNGKPCNYMWVTAACSASREKVYYDVYHFDYVTQAKGV